MHDALRWRLLYANGDQADEPEETTSILVCRAGAMAIVVTVAAEGVPPEKRQGVAMEYMTAERLLGFSAWCPIFYRKRSMGLGGDSRTEFVVFGRGCEGGNRIEARLWTLREGKIVTCPAWAMDAGAVQGLVMESLSGVTR